MKRLRGGTLFSGIGAPEISASEIDWRWCAEIEKFPSAVMAHYHPNQRNLGDVTKVDWEEVRRTEPVDIVVFGSPCQTFSIAGKRAGLDDPRGNLALIALGIIRTLRPRWFVFENVDGLLSSDGGRDFGTFLGEVDKCGYGWSYRLIDAQYCGVAQRRVRVFVVGYFGDWRPPCAVLLEQKSLSWNPAPSRKAGQEVAGPIGAGTEGSGFPVDTDRTHFVSTYWDGGQLSDTLDLSQISKQQMMPEKRRFPVVLQPEIAPNSSHTADSDNFVVTHAFRAEGHDASEDGTGRGTPIIPCAFRTAGDGAAYHEGDKTAPLTQQSDPNTNVIAFGISGRMRGAEPSVGRPEREPSIMIEKVGALEAQKPPSVAIAFDTTQITSKDNRSNPQPGEPCHPLASKGHAPALAFTERTRPEGRTIESQEDLAYALLNPGSGGRANANSVLDTRIRRLTPGECEILQGFPKGFTDIPYSSHKVSKTKTKALLKIVKIKRAADSPRYRAIGNSMAVPVIGWILKRIQLFREVMNDPD